MRAGHRGVFDDGAPWRPSGRARRRRAGPAAAGGRRSTAPRPGRQRATVGQGEASAERERRGPESVAPGRAWPWQAPRADPASVGIAKRHGYRGTAHPRQDAIAGAPRGSRRVTGVSASRPARRRGAEPVERIAQPSSLDRRTARCASRGAAPARAGAGGGAPPRPTRPCCSTIRPTQAQPKWALTRSMTTGARCCSSMREGALDPHDQRAGVGRIGRLRRRLGHCSLTAGNSAASRSPTISGHAARMSVEAKPCAAKAGPMQPSIEFGQRFDARHGGPAPSVRRLRRMVAKGGRTGVAPLIAPGSGYAAHRSTCPAPRTRPEPEPSRTARRRPPGLVRPASARPALAALPGERPDPYRVWLSEVMLQQTTIAAVSPISRDSWRASPTSRRSRRRREEAVMSAWAGLGYYSRARNLHACAKAVAAAGGRFPDTRRRPAQASGHRRLHGRRHRGDRVRPAGGGGRRQCRARDEPGCSRSRRRCPAAGRRSAALTQALVPDDRPGDFAQAVMDLGATICTPQAPGLRALPLDARPAARRAPATRSLPAQDQGGQGRAAPRRGLRGGPRGDEAVLLRTRPPEGPARQHGRAAEQRLGAGLRCRRRAAGRAPRRAAGSACRGSCGTASRISRWS